MPEAQGVIAEETIHRRFWSYVQAAAMRHEGLKQCVPTSLRRLCRRILAGEHDAIPEGVIRHKDGRLLFVGPDRIYWRIYCGLDFEPGPTKLVQSLLGKGDTVLDVGANFGWYTTIFARQVQNGGRVFAFEPVPAAFEQLQKNIQINNVGDRCMLNQMALGSTEGTVDLHVFEDLPLSHSSVSDLGRSSFKTFPAPLTTIDRFMESHAVKRVDFFKCDVEGAELAVFYGAADLLRHKDAPIVMFECNAETSAAVGWNPNEVIRFLRDCGYDHLFEIDDSGGVARVPFGSNLELHEKNLVAAKSKRVLASHVLARGGVSDFGRQAN